MLKNLLIVLVTLTTLNDMAIAQQSEDAITDAQKVLARMNEDIASVRHKAGIELFNIIKKEKREGREGNANIILAKIDDLEKVVAIENEVSQFNEKELPKNTWHKYHCIANMKQIQGAFEQAELAGIKTPSLNDVIGPKGYILEMPTCPTTKAPYTAINPPECPSKVPSHVLP